MESKKVSEFKKPSGSFAPMLLHFHIITMSLIILYITCSKMLWITWSSSWPSGWNPNLNPSMYTTESQFTWLCAHWNLTARFFFFSKKMNTYLEDHSTLCVCWNSFANWVAVEVRFFNAYNWIFSRTYRSCTTSMLLSHITHLKISVP